MAIVGGEKVIDFKELIENSTSIPTADTAFINAQKLPFCVFLDRQDASGDDKKHVQVIEHDLAVEFYAERIDSANESKLEELFKQQGWEYTRERTYLSDEECFETIYQMNFKERK